MIIPAGKMANSRKLVSWKKCKNPLGEKKAIEIRAEIFEKYPLSEYQESVKPSSLKNSSDLVSLTYAGYYFVRLVLFFLIQAYVSWICLHSVSNWSYWSRTNPSMACVAGAWKGRERGFLAPRVSFALKTPFPFPFKRLSHRLICLCWRILMRE